MLDKDSCILVVDDIQPARETVMNILRVLGYKNIQEGANGEEALQVLENNPGIKLVISDWKMPRMNGAELLHRIRSREEWEDIPFLFLTSKSETEDVAQACDLGVTEYMVKPLEVDVLLDKLKHLDSMNPRHKLTAVLRETRELCKNSEFAAAEEKLVAFLKEAPSLESRILYELAAVLFQAGEPHRAKEAVDKALDINPLMSRAWHLRAKLEMAGEQWSEAQKSLDKALEINPRSVDCLLTLGDVCLLDGDFVRARESFQKAINVAPKESWIKQEIWGLYTARNLGEEGEKGFAPFIFEYLSSDVLNNYAVFLRKQGRMEDAADLYATALNKDPDNCKLLYNAAIADYYHEKKTRAIKRLKRALELEPGFGQAESLLRRFQRSEQPQ
ncbi:MAG: response regulator [Desulfonatronovibrionaceae bacterium]